MCTCANDNTPNELKIKGKMNINMYMLFCLLFNIIIIYNQNSSTTIPYDDCIFLKRTALFKIELTSES
jgi:hypothetical protein